MSLSRRQRYRAATRQEIKALALRQIALGGVAALSLNAIAREMAVSGAALYRYFASRDELLADLAVDACEELASVLEAVAAAPHPSPKARLHAIADANRDWARAQPHAYRLAFCCPIGPGGLAAERLSPAAQRCLTVLVEAVSTVATQRAVASPDQSFVGWTRLHGVLSLELEGHLAAAGLDPALLYRAEVDSLTAECPTGQGSVGCAAPAISPTTTS